MKAFSWVMGIVMWFGVVGVASEVNTAKVKSISGNEIDVFPSDLRAAYLLTFGLGASKNYEARMENEDGTVTLAGIRYRHQGRQYRIAIFHHSKEDASGVCKLFGFMAAQLYEKEEALDPLCAAIDKAGHFSGLRDRHATFYDCLENITCIL